MRVFDSVLISIDVGSFITFNASEEVVSNGISKKLVIIMYILNEKLQLWKLGKLFFRPTIRIFPRHFDIFLH